MWVTSARKRTKVTGGGGLVLPDYLEAFEVNAYYYNNNINYGFEMGYTISSAFYQQPDYEAFALRENFFDIALVFQTPAGYPIRKVVSTGRSLQVGHGTQPLGVVDNNNAFQGMGTVGENTVLPYRIEFIGSETQIVFSRTANEGEYSHTLTLPAYYPPDITAALPTPQYLYGTSPVDVGIHDKKTTVTVTSLDFPAPDYLGGGHVYNVYLDLETHNGLTWGGATAATIQSVVADTNLNTLAGTFSDLFPLDVTLYTPRRLRYRVVSGAYTKTGPWSATFCYPPKLLPDTSAETGLAFGFDYDTLQFTAHKLRMTSFKLDGTDSTVTNTVRLKVRYYSTTQVNPTQTVYFYSGTQNNYHIAPGDTPSSIYTPATTSTTGPDQLAPGDVIANPGSSTLFSIIPSLWSSLLGGDDFIGLTTTYTTADARARIGFRNEWLDFTSAKQTPLALPSVTSFDMSMALVPESKHWWQLSVNTFANNNWPVGNYTDYRAVVQPRRHQTNDGDSLNIILYDRTETTGVKARIGGGPSNIDFAADPEITPPRNYLWSSQWVQMNGDTYAGQNFTPTNRIIYTAPLVNSVTFDTVALVDTGAGYTVRATAFTGFNMGFVGGEKNTYDVDIYISVNGSATTPAECEVGPISVSLSTASFPVTLHTFDRTATTPYKWGSSYVTNGDAQTHKLFAVVGYTPNPANGETVESMSQIGPLHTAIVSGVNVPQIPQVPVPVSHWTFDGDLQNVMSPGDGATVTVHIDATYAEVTPTPTGDTWFGTAATKRRIKLPGDGPTAPEIQTPYLQFSYPDDSSGSDSLATRQSIFWSRFTDTTYSADPVTHAFSVAVTFRTKATSAFVFNAWQPSDVLGANTTRTGGYLYIYDNGLYAMMYKGLGTQLINGYASLTNASYNMIDTTNTHHIVMTFKRHFYSIGAPDMANDYTLKAYFDGQLRVDQTLNNSSEVVDTTKNTSGYYYCNRMGGAGNVTASGGCEVYDYQMFDYELSDTDVNALYGLIDTAHD